MRVKCPYCNNLQLTNASINSRKKCVYCPKYFRIKDNLMRFFIKQKCKSCGWYAYVNKQGLCETCSKKD